MLTTPILSEIKTFDANNENIFMFQSVGGDQVTGSRLTIEKVSDNTIVYEGSSANLSFKHLLPAETLSNGVNYRARIRTKGRNTQEDRIETWSASSAPLLFWCYSKPELNITNIDENGRVNNQTVEFKTTYLQTEGETLQSYRYILYNENKNLLKSFSEIYSNGDSELIQQITGLENGISYYLEVKTISANGNIGTTGLVNFKPMYIIPKLMVRLEPENLIEKGAIKISTDIVQILLKLYDINGNEIDPSTIEYENDEWIDMTRNDYYKLVADNGFKISQSDFILQIWCKDLPENKIFLTLFSSNGKIEMFKSNKRIRVYKSINNLKFKNYYVSGEFDSTGSQELSIYMRQENNLIDLKVEAMLS